VNDLMTQREEELSRRVEWLERELESKSKPGNPHKVMLNDVKVILTSGNESLEEMLERAWNYGYFEGKYGGE
jgi:hypothetical protein